MTPADRPIVVYHVAAMGDWQDVVREQLVMLADSGLGVDEPVRVTFVGRGTGWFLAAARTAGVQVEIVRADENVNHYETFAMLEIERLAKVERVDRPILYLHTKGVSNPGDRHKRRWRLLMEDYVVRSWRANVAILAGGQYDAVGVNWWQQGEQHFSGNVWMAHPDWLRRLPDYVRYHHGKNLTRYSCEMYIGAAQWCRAYSHLTHDQMFWVDGYDLRPYPRTMPLVELVERGWDQPFLAVVTACSRPANLPVIAQSLKPLSRYFNVQWIIVVDTSGASAEDVYRALPDDLDSWADFTVLEEPSDGAGMRQKNAGIARAVADFGGAAAGSDARGAGELGWLYVLDDDNCAHPGLGAMATRARLTYPDAGVFVFEQAENDGRHRLDAGPVRWGHIDTASSLVRLDLVGEATFRAYPDAVGDDYLFIRAVWEEHWTRFRFIPRVAAYYNKLPPMIQPDGCPVPLAQDGWEFRLLCREVEFLSPRRVVEIGSLYGGSLYRWLQLRQPARVVSIDKRPDSTEPWYDPAVHGTFLDACREKWAGWEGADRLVQFAEPSQAPGLPARVSEALGGPIDFLFIDGDHGEAAVQADWDIWHPLVRKGGIVAFHDVVGIPGVAAVWERVRQGRRHTLISAGARGLGIGVVYL